MDILEPNIPCVNTFNISIIFSFTFKKGITWHIARLFLHFYYSSTLTIRKRNTFSMILILFSTSAGELLGERNVIK